MNFIKIISIIILISKCHSNYKRKPNIIIFLVDDLGWQDTSVPFWKEKTNFNRIYKTPNMERLASEGMKFTQAYATPVCTPTRVSLISGMNAARHRVTNWTLRRNISMVKDPVGLQIPMWNMNGAQPIDSIENSIFLASSTHTKKQQLQNHSRWKSSLWCLNYTRSKSIKFRV